MSVVYNTYIQPSNLQLLLDASSPRSWSPNVHPYPLDIYAWASAGGAYQATLSRDTSTGTSPAGGVPMLMATATPGTSAYVGSYNSPTWNLAAAANGQTWTVSFWVKGSSAFTASMLIFEANSAGGYTTYGHPFYNVTTNWTKVTGTYTMTQATTAYIQMRFDCYNSGVNMWVDGLQVEQSSSATTFNSRSNPSRIWTDLSGNSRNFTWDGTNGVQYTSNGSMSYFSTNGTRATGPASNSFNINNGTGYTIFMVSTTQTNNSNSSFKFYNTNGKNSSSTSRGIFNHPGWSNYTMYFDQSTCCGADQRTSYSFTSADMVNFRVWTFRSRLYDRDIFMNGTSYINNTTYAGNINLGSATVDLGSSDEYGGAASYWNGQLAYFAVYNTGLDNTTVRTIARNIGMRFGI